MRNDCPVNSGSASKAEQRRGSLRAIVDVTLLSTGVVFLNVGLVGGNAYLWVPGVMLTAAGGIRMATFLRRIAQSARTPEAIAAQAEEAQRWKDVEPDRNRTGTVEIRLPKARRQAGLMAGCAAMFVFVGAACLTPPANVAGVVSGFGLAIGTFAIAYRIARLGVVGSPDSLVVRNLVSSHSIPKREIVGFDIAYPSGGELFRGASSGPAIVLTTQGGRRIQLAATTGGPRVKGGRERLEPSLAMLRGWLAR